MSTSTTTATHGADPETVHGTAIHAADLETVDSNAIHGADLETVDDPERGDVPGWVLVTLMTAGLVVALWAIAGPALTGVFEDAIARVTGFGG